MPTPGLDPDNTNPAYIAGQLVAVLDNLQRVAHGGSVNATFTSKYLSAAISNPRRVLVTGRQQAEAWLKKATRVNPGAGFAIRKEMDRLFDLLPADGVPSQLADDGKSNVILGYHHYRSNSFRKSALSSGSRVTTGEETGPAKPAEPTEPTEPDLLTLLDLPDCA